MVFITDLDWERLKVNIEKLGKYGDRNAPSFVNLQIARANTAMILDNIDTLMKDPTGRLK